MIWGLAATLGVLSGCGSEEPTAPDHGSSSGSSGQATSGAAGAAARGGTGAGGSAGTGVSSGGAGSASTAGRGSGGTAGTGAPPPGGAAGQASMSAGGNASGAGGSSGSAGTPAGGLGGTSNVDGGRGGQTGGGGGNAGSGSGGVWGICPDGTTGVPTLTGTPMRITSVPPHDTFNNDNNDWGNVEGPLWIGDSLYVSEMSSQSYGGTGSPDQEIKKSRILKVSASGQTSIWVADSGSNGLAVDAQGSIVAGVHKDGSIQRFAVPAGTATPVATMYMGKRFNSPNDLVVHSNGTIYFTDPTYNGPSTPPQTAMRAYRIPSGGQPEPIPSAASPDTFTNPNGITLSPAEDFLYVGAMIGRRYPVMADGTLGAGQDFAALSGADGVTVDCAGNLYVVTSGKPTMKAYKPDGSSIGTLTVSDVEALTNVAFGGADHKTLYLTGYGTNKGLFQLTLNIPGKPY